jgi:hypothetical protein
LTNITVYKLDNIAEIEEIIDPRKLLYMFIGQLDKKFKDVE